MTSHRDEPTEFEGYYAGRNRPEPGSYYVDPPPAVDPPGSWGESTSSAPSCLRCGSELEPDTGWGCPSCWCPDPLDPQD